MMAEFALRRSVGPFSSGTRLNIISTNSDGTCTVEMLVQPNETISLEDLTFDLEHDYIVQLRPRVGEVPVENRRMRRVEKRLIDRMLKEQK